LTPCTQIYVTDGTNQLILFRFYVVRTWQCVFCALMSCNKVGEHRHFLENNMFLLFSDPDWSVFHLCFPLTMIDTRKPHSHPNHISNLSVGCSTGMAVGCSTGMSVGCSTGMLVGCSTGMSVGCSIDMAMGFYRHVSRMFYRHCNGILPTCQ
jgi:hypothetical protein